MSPVFPYFQFSSKNLYNAESFLGLRMLSKALNSRLLLLEYCSNSLLLSFSAFVDKETDLRGSEGYRRLALELLGEGDLLRRDPKRVREKWSGEAARLSFSGFRLFEFLMKDKFPCLENCCGDCNVESISLTYNEGLSIVVACATLLN